MKRKKTIETKISLLICFTSLTMSLFGQNDITNQLDSNGKKNGKWIEYLNAKWKVLKDTSDAVYYRYTYYEHGINLYGTAGHSRLNSKLEFSGSNSKQSDKIKILDGEYKWFDKKGRVITIENYKNGEIVWAKDFAWHVSDTWLGKLFGYKNKLTGTLHEYDDFTKKYKEQPHTFYSEIYNEKGEIKTYYTRADKYGWCAYEE